MPAGDWQDAEGRLPGMEPPPCPHPGIVSAAGDKGEPWMSWCAACGMPGPEAWAEILERRAREDGHGA